MCTFSARPACCLSVGSITVTFGSSVNGVCWIKAADKSSSRSSSPQTDPPHPHTCLCSRCFFQLFIDLCAVIGCWLSERTNHVSELSPSSVCSDSFVDCSRLFWTILCCHGNCLSLAQLQHTDSRLITDYWFWAQQRSVSLSSSSSLQAASSSSSFSWWLILGASCLLAATFASFRLYEVCREQAEEEEEAGGDSSSQEG